MKLLFLRRRGLGAGSIRGMLTCLNGCSPVSLKSYQGETAGTCLNTSIHADMLLSHISECMLVRWGCTSTTSTPLENQLNTSQAIKEVNHKKNFRLKVQGMYPTLVPTTTTQCDTTTTAGPMVVRPAHHSQGKNLWVVQNREELEAVVARHNLGSDWYASTLIDKVAEYRVYIVKGRVVTVAKKTPADPSAVAWNVAQGGRFDVVRWGDWPMEAVRVAVESFNCSSLDFGGVDVMVDREGEAYCIEINSAPSLPMLSDGRVSYRQECMAKAFLYTYDNREAMEIDSYGSWRGVIHPAIYAS